MVQLVMENFARIVLDDRVGKRDLGEIRFDERGAGSARASHRDALRLDARSGGGVGIILGFEVFEVEREVEHGDVEIGRVIGERGLGAEQQRHGGGRERGGHAGDAGAPEERPAAGEGGKRG